MTSKKRILMHSSTLLAASIILIVFLLVIINKIDDKNQNPITGYVPESVEQRKKEFSFTGEMVDGIDVSYWNDNIDWEQVGQAGIKFAFIRATQGNSYIDSKFEFNIQEANRVGILAGAYHFAEPLRNRADNEAKHFASVIKQYLTNGYLRPVLDLEKGAELNTAELSAWVNLFMDTFKSETGVEPLLYANPSYIKHELDHSIDEYDLWIAHWGGVSQPGISREWDFWQYGGTKDFPGIRGKLDLNIFKGNIDELRAKFEIGGRTGPIDLGTYSTNPNFEVTINYNIHDYQTIMNQIKTFVNNVESCKETLPDPEDPNAIRIPGEPTTITGCVRKYKPTEWNLAYTDNENFAFEIRSNQKFAFYNGQTNEETYVVYKFALYFGETSYQIEQYLNTPKIDFSAPIYLTGIRDFSSFGETVDGIDVSHWNDDINWEQVGQAGIKFAFIKATQGTRFIDNRFEFNIQEANRVGILAGAYHFADPVRHNAAHAAKHFARVTKPYLTNGYLRPVLDLEWGAELSTAELSAWVNLFMDTFKSETGVEPLIYTNPNYIKNQLDHSIDKYDLWIAHWGGVPQPGISREWDFWQYGGTRDFPGIRGKLDLNIFKGSISELMDKFEINYIEESTPPSNKVEDSD